MTRRQVVLRAVVAAIVMALSLALAPSAIAATPDPLTRTVIIGDSFSTGFKASPGNGYHELLDRDFNSRGRDVETFAVNGATAHLWLQCIATPAPAGCPGEYAQQIARMVTYHNPTAVIIALGANERLYSRPAAEYGGHIRQIVASARNAFPHLHVVLVHYYDIAGHGIVPAPPGSTCDLPGHCAGYRTHVNWAEYGIQLQAIARDTNSQFIDASQGFDHRHIAPDMGHPNDEGNRRLFELVRAQLG